MLRAALIAGILSSLASTPVAEAKGAKPNIVVIMTDDMGFSDIGCYGGEIETPNLDALAAGGLKFSQFYNCAKCEPSRASLLTGHHWWTYNPDVQVRRESPNLGEVIRPAGYRTMMVGKWHAEGHPFERGFDRHFGFMGGATDSFLGDDSFTLDGEPWEVPDEDFYATSSLTEHAARFIREEKTAHPDRPFFLYVGYNAPHSPIQARADDLAKYRGKYLAGWDVIRERRFEKQQELGLAGPGWHLPGRPANIPAWETLDEKSKDFEDLRMATYAAMIDRVDQGVGEIVDALEAVGQRDDTLILFLNDNGASPNDRVRRQAFGTPGTTWNVGLPWAQVSCTPFKFYKRTQHSGGVTTPFIANWPAGITPGEDYMDQPCHLMDILPTLLELSGATYPGDFGGKDQPPLPGRSFAPILTDGAVLPARTLYFSLFNNMAVVHDRWRLVTAYGRPWELYDLTNDRAETRNLARERPDKLEELLAIQEAFHDRDDVRLRLKSGEREPAYAPIYDEDGRIGPGFREAPDDPALALLLAKARAGGREPDAAELAALKRAADGQKPRP